MHATLTEEQQPDPQSAPRPGPGPGARRPAGGPDRSGPVAPGPRDPVRPRPPGRGPAELHALPRSIGSGSSAPARSRSPWSGPGAAGASPAWTASRRPPGGWMPCSTAWRASSVACRWPPAPRPRPASRSPTRTPGGSPWARATRTWPSCTSGEAAGLRRQYARPAGDKAVYEAELTPTDLPAKAEDWADRALLRRDERDVQRLEIPGITLERGEDGWRLADQAPGEVLDQTAAEELVRRLRDLSFTSVLGLEAKPEFGQDAPVLEVRLGLASGDTPVYRLSRQAQAPGAGRGPAASSSRSRTSPGTSGSPTGPWSPCSRPPGRGCWSSPNPRPHPKGRPSHAGSQLGSGRRSGRRSGRPAADPRAVAPCEELIGTNRLGSGRGCEACSGPWRRSHRRSGSRGGVALHEGRPSGASRAGPPQGPG